jgi:hypothetical protein
MITSGDLYDALLLHWTNNGQPRWFMYPRGVEQLYRYVRQADESAGFLAINKEEDVVDYVDPQSKKQWLAYYGPQTTNSNPDFE